MTDSKAETQVVMIRPPGRFSALNLRDLWLYRELVYFMTWRDIIVRYKQTLLGASWAVLRPFLSMVVFSIFFGNLAKIGSTLDIPYPVFNFTALLPWELFATSLSVASRSLVQSSNMITKIYFPRIILPLSSILAGVVDFAIALVVLFGIMFFYHVPVSGHIWAMPLFLLLALIAALGVGLWLSALNVLYRDIGYVTPFLTQFWLFITPIVYPANLVTGQWAIVYALNPMVGVVEGFRWSLLGMEQSAPGPTTIVSVVVAVVLLISGLFYFRQMERQFADRV